MKIKRAFALLLAAALLLSACSRETRFDFLELNARLRSADRRFCFPEDAVFYKDGAYYAYCSLQNTNDALLTMREDARGKLDKISLTLAAEDAEAAALFTDFAKTLAKIFIPDCDLPALCEATGLSPEALFRETMRSYPQGRYTAVLFGSEKGVCFFIERT